MIQNKAMRKKIKRQLYILMSLIFTVVKTFYVVKIIRKTL